MNCNGNNVRISEELAFQILQLNMKRFENDFIRKRQEFTDEVYTHVKFQFPEIKLIQNDNKPYWLIQLRNIKISGFVRKDLNLFFSNTCLINDDKTKWMSSCLINATNGEYIYLPDVEDFKE